MGTTKHHFIFVGLAILIGFSALDSTALTLTELELANKGVKPVVGALKDVATIPNAAAGILYLPQGAVKTAIGLLPGPSTKVGFQEMGRGVRATVGLVQRIIQLPFKLLGRATKIPASLK